MKEIDRERDSGQPDIPGLQVPRDDSGNLVGGCPDFMCPEDVFPLSFLGLSAGQVVVDDAVPDGTDFKTPAPSRRIRDVWYDDLQAVKGDHYTTPDDNTISPTQPLSPDTQVRVRFEAY